MFESLSDRFDGIFSRLRKRGTLTADDVDEITRCSALLSEAVGG